MECKLSTGLTIHYEEFGTGRPFLGLHGWGLDHHHVSFELEPNFVHRSGWRRIYPDLPGMGHTPAADWITSSDQMLDVILEFMATLAPGERFVVGGHSYGAYLARGVIYRQSQNVDGVFLNAPPVPWHKNPDLLPKHQVLKQDAEFLTALKPEEKGWTGLFVAQRMEALDGFRQAIASLGPPDQEFLNRLGLNGAFSFEVDLETQTFLPPVLILTGHQDSWVGYRKVYDLVERFPRATYAVLDCAGHAVAYEQKALHRALVSEWLDRVEDFITERA
jgi:pimeloyl-ACP methyl ester carboxylesterase